MAMPVQALGHPPRAVAYCGLIPSRMPHAMNAVKTLSLILFLAQAGLYAWAAHAAQDGVVSTSHPAASAAGARILAQGGNAVDAAAAIQFALNVVEPQSSGMGGGGFMMVYLAKTREIVIVDSRERAPGRANASQFAPDGQPLAFALASTSGLSVGVPGTVRGVDLALRRWGTLSLADALVPAIELAESGFRVNRFLADDIAHDGGRTALYPETAAIFRPGGRALLEGDWLVQPDLAKTLKLLARNGARAFYDGPLAAAIVRAQSRGRSELGDAGHGRMTRADLTAYQPTLRKPLIGHYRGWTLATMPPPSSGGLTMLQMLGMMERFPLGGVAQGYGPGSARTLHVMVEAMRLAFADRAVWIGDEDRQTGISGQDLLHPAYLAARSALIDPERRLENVTAGRPRGLDPERVSARRGGARAESPHTTHFAVMDKHGNVVTYTSTIEHTWGSGITVPGYGFLLNNELTDFNFLPAADTVSGNPGANDVAPGKRPRSSMAPTLLLKDGQVVAAYGSPGGATIINTVLNVTVNLIDHGMNMQQAIDAPRISVTHPAGTLSCEGSGSGLPAGISPASQLALRTLGHGGLDSAREDACQATIGSVQAVTVDTSNGRHDGAADPRREGTVIRVVR